MTRSTLALHLAWRFLRSGRTQSVLILAGVSVGVGAFVFISALLGGLQADLVERTLGTQAHLVVLPDAPPPRTLRESREGALFARRVEPVEPRLRPFDQWQRVVRAMEGTSGVAAVCPKVSGAALAVRGSTEVGVEVVGADPGRLREVVDLPGFLVAGRYRLASEAAVVGRGLAEELGVDVGDPLRLSTGQGEQRLRIAGIVAVGASAIDDRWVVVSLRTGQQLLGRVGDVTAIEATVDDIFAADAVAADIAARTGLVVESWMDRNAQLTTALRSQDISSGMIRLFVMVAVAMGIASVLVVSVVQRRGQIGVLRAIGVPRRTVLQVFLWQGVLLGGAGAFLGSALGFVVVAGLQRLLFFDVRVGPTVLALAAAISMMTGIVSALVPARSAARLDPATAIRGDG